MAEERYVTNMATYIIATLEECGYTPVESKINKDFIVMIKDPKKIDSTVPKRNNEDKTSKDILNIISVCCSDEQSCDVNYKTNVQQRLAIELYAHSKYEKGDNSETFIKKMNEECGLYSVNYLRKALKKQGLNPSDLMPYNKNRKQLESMIKNPDNLLKIIKTNEIKKVVNNKTRNKEFIENEAKKAMEERRKMYDGMCSKATSKNAPSFDRK